MIQVFCKNPSERLIYVLDFMFKSKGEEYVICTSESDWEKIEGKKFNYSNRMVEGDLSIEPSGLLNETELYAQLKLERVEGNLTLRNSRDELSIIFYTLSRYEEYQPYQKDEHGRFLSKFSQQHSLGILDSPFVDEITKTIWEKLGLDYTSVLESFQCVPSFDIDVAWAFKGRPLWRTIGGLVKNQGEGRLKVLLNKKKDPYDTYSYITNVSAKVRRIICFALLSDWGKYDKNIHWKNEEYQSLIRGLNSSGGMGIHPGYNSHLNAEIQRNEIERLEEIVGHEVQKSRFHFLRFEMGKSYDLLIQNGIKKDYSMGYSDRSGFRAGTSFPFYYFNLKKNKAEDLLIFPFAYMDSALKDKMNLSSEEALKHVEQIIDKTAKVGGLFMCIWHNSSVTDKGEWKGWRDVLDRTVDHSLLKRLI
ncbi:MAG: hypothetical protein BM555_02015 [Crocinitomix sp. MedPE-SWsnd]|nr:MAG: hypothetical protein BM555_02015 [Crocinitomix sp. MedPE-SWsnd]